LFLLSVHGIKKRKGILQRKASLLRERHAVQTGGLRTRRRKRRPKPIPRRAEDKAFAGRAKDAAGERPLSRKTKGWMLRKPEQLHYT